MKAALASSGPTGAAKNAADHTKRSRLKKSIPLHQMAANQPSLPLKSMSGDSPPSDSDDDWEKSQAV